ncbi:MAG: hypothetical protein U9R01_02145 [candidate division WOR-3 bacterium]|nr:hypothetical protein [candidate division WOR-3 bacterium]
MSFGLIITGCEKLTELLEGEPEVSLRISLPDPAQHPLWNNVRTVTLTVTAEDMDAVTETKNVTPGDTIVVFTLQVSAGDDRLFTLDAKDEQGVVLFWGKIKVDVTTGQAYNFDINLV